MKGSEDAELMALEELLKKIQAAKLAQTGLGEDMPEGEEGGLSLEDLPALSEGESAEGTDEISELEGQEEGTPEGIDEDEFQAYFKARPGSGGKPLVTKMGGAGLAMPPKGMPSKKKA